MKKFYTSIAAFLIAVLAPVSALAYEVPQDAVIKVYDKNGKEIGSMSRKDYKVVKVDSEPRITVSAASHAASGAYNAGVSNGVRAGVDAGVAAERSRIKYSAIVTGGTGYDGVQQSYSGGAYSVTEKGSAVGQGTLCAEKNRFGLCGTASTNRFYGLGLKINLN